MLIVYLNSEHAIIGQHTLIRKPQKYSLYKTGIQSSGYLLKAFPKPVILIVPSFDGLRFLSLRTMLQSKIKGHVFVLQGRRRGTGRGDVGGKLAGAVLGSRVRGKGGPESRSL